MKIFDENIVKCHRGEGVKINAVLSFNREECFLGIDGTYETGYKMLNNFDKESFTIDVDEKILNCIFRFGTIKLKSN